MWSRTTAYMRRSSTHSCERGRGWRGRFSGCPLMPRYALRATRHERSCQPNSRLAARRGRVQSNGVADECLQRLLVDFRALVEVDGAPCVAFETRVKEAGGVLQRGALEECQLDHALVGLTSTNISVVGPDRYSGVRGFHPLPLLDDIGVHFLDDLSHLAERLAPPVA